MADGRMTGVRGLYALAAGEEPGMLLDGPSATDAFLALRDAGIVGDGGVVSVTGEGDDREVLVQYDEGEDGEPLALAMKRQPDGWLLGTREG